MVHQDHLNNAKQTGHKTGLLSLSTKPLCEQRRGANYQNIRQKQDQKAKIGYIQYKTTKADDPF